MEKKKGNTLLITLIFIFLIRSFIGAYILINRISSNQINNFIEKINTERTLENDAYEFYLLNIKENDTFILEENYIKYKIDRNIKFFVSIENNIINIRKEVN